MGLLDSRSKAGGHPHSGCRSILAIAYRWLSHSIFDANGAICSGWNCCVDRTATSCFASLDYRTETL